MATTSLRMGMRSENSSGEVEKATVLKCLGCGDSLVVAEVWAESGRFEGVSWYPMPEELVDSVSGLPEEVRGAYQEGVRCIGVRAPHAAVAMFRTALAQIVEDKGSETAKKKNSLYDRIDQMVAEKTLWESFGLWATHIRTTGNAGAHPEKFEPVTQEQAEDLSAFVRQVIEFLYVQPARIAKAMPVLKKAAPTPGNP